ncbi:MAG: helix-turn-helix domain-containing protein [Bacteroidetes bacterium]|nr:helix-turn-helix domain-containing protein [Bacteroidota bacterium]
MKDIASILLLLGAAQGIFFGLVLLGLRKGNQQANRWLAGFLICFSLSMVGTVLYDQRWVVMCPHLGLVSAPIGTALGSLLFLYVKSLAERNYQFQGWQWLHLLPVVVSLGILAPFYFLPLEEKRVAMEASYSGFPVLWKANFIFATIVTTCYLIATLVKITRHERHIRQLYSNMEHKSLVWVRHFLFAGASTFFICIIMSFFDIAAADTISNLMFSVVIYVMGYRALRQPEIFAGLPEQTVAETDEPALVKMPVKYEKSGLTEEKAKALMAKLDALFTWGKIYLDPELTLQQLADRLGVTPHLVSQLLNQHKQQSFFDFVNGCRVAHFKTAVNDPANAHLSLLGIAFDSGFNSKAAFNAVFKKMTGTTPSAFRGEVAR